MSAVYNKGHIHSDIFSRQSQIFNHHIWAKHIFDALVIWLLFFTINRAYLFYDLLASEKLKDVFSYIIIFYVAGTQKPESASDLSSHSSSLWHEFDNLAAESLVGAHKNTEVNTYLNMPLLERTGNPLKWWEQNEKLLPNLCKLAVAYLGIPATETACERVFSSAGNIVSSKRESLTTQHIEELVFLHENRTLYWVCFSKRV